MTQKLTQKRELLLEIVPVILQVMGTNADITGPITMESSFSADLEIDSVGLVVLTERVQRKFGSRIDLAQWISSKGYIEVIHLTVGDLVDFIGQANLNRSPASVAFNRNEFQLVA